MTRWGIPPWTPSAAGASKDSPFAIETAGTLPDGRSFKRHKDLRTLLKADINPFPEGLAVKMLIYALGRGLEHSDKKSVRTVADKVAKEGYRFSSLVLEIVQSEAFQMGGKGREGGR
jgi:uncharacterized protein DUF1585